MQSFLFTRDVLSKMSSVKKNSLIAGKKCCDCPDYFSQLILRKPPQTSRIVMSRISPSLLQDGESFRTQVVFLSQFHLRENFQWNENALWSSALKSNKNLSSTHSLYINIIFFFQSKIELSSYFVEHLEISCVLILINDYTRNISRKVFPLFIF